MSDISLQPTETLSMLAKRYVWWDTPEWAVQHPKVFLSNVMNLGHWDDIQMLRREVGDDTLKVVLQNAPAGYFSYRSWDYWHVILNVHPISELPSREL